jgi:hypothetical protein
MRVPETIGSYLRRRYRWALSGIVGGALGALLCGSLLSARGDSSQVLAFQGACAVVWGGALLVAARTHCPKCHAPVAERVSRVIPVMLLFALGTPPGRCPRCGTSLGERCP